MNREQSNETLVEHLFQFKAQFDLLSSCTTEYMTTALHIVDTVVKNLPQQTHLIDVGAGRGNLAKPLSSYFETTTIIEPNQFYHDEVLAWAERNSRTFHGENIDWLRADIVQTPADLVLMSHVMYYVDKSQWSVFIRKAYDLLRPGGQIVLILNSRENTVGDLYKQFLPMEEWSQIASSEAILEALRTDNYSDVQVSDYDANIVAHSQEEIFELIDFLLRHRVDFADIENQTIREKYAETYLRNEDNYVIWTGGHLITISKPHQSVEDEAVLEDTFNPERNKLYKEQFDILTFNTQEYDDMRSFLRNQIFPKLPAMGHFLDIGAGRGNYVRHFSQEFTRTTIVEPNDVFFGEIQTWARENNVDIEGHNCTWQDVEFDAQVDLLLMSHMLYYVPQAERLDFIRKAYQHLKPGGCLIIALNAEGDGTREIYKAFCPPDMYASMPSGEEIAQLMRDNGFPNVQEEYVPAEISVPTMNDLHMLIDFLLLRKIPFETAKQIKHRQDFIEAHLIRDGKLVLNSDSTIVVVQKPDA